MSCKARLLNSYLDEVYVQIMDAHKQLLREEKVITAQAIKALPDLKNTQYEVALSETQLTSGIFLAGDTQLNVSLNALMYSCEKATFGVLENIDDFKFS